MAQFLKFTLASMIGVALALVLLFIIGSGVLSSAISQAADQKPKIDNNSVLHLKFNKEIPEKPTNNPLERLNFENNQFSTRPALKTYLDVLEKAAGDDRIEGIYLDLSGTPVGFAQLQALRRNLQAFRDSGKFVYAYGENLTQKAYYLASVADTVHLHPEGNLLFRGLSTVVSFFKGALEKLDVEVQVFKVGKYKGAVEPYTNEEFSEPNREQISALLNGIYGEYLSTLSKARELPVDTLRAYADGLRVRTAEDALELGMVDQLSFTDQVLDGIRKRIGLGKAEDISMVDFGTYRSAIKQGGLSLQEKDNQVAVIFAEGAIVTGPAQDGSIGSESLSQTIREARRDSAIKAIVLRINSPGGSALASDVIAREVKLAQQEKPVVVSMGNLAASGGYYISAPAGHIMAEPNTITGSIGVFAIFPNFKELMNDKLGITFDRVKTGPYSDFPDPFRPMTQDEQAIFQDFIDDIYQTFLERVAKGRDMTTDQVHELAQGRVYTGEQALQNKLVDEVGGIEEAIRKAASMAGLKEYGVKELPKTKSPIQKLVDFLQKQVATRPLDPVSRRILDETQTLRDLARMQGPTAILPYRIEIE